MDRYISVYIATCWVDFVFAVAGQAPEIDVARVHRRKNIAKRIQRTKDGVVGQNDFIIDGQVCPTHGIEAGFVAPDVEALVLTHDHVRCESKQFLLFLDQDLAVDDNDKCLQVFLEVG